MFNQVQANKIARKILGSNEENIFAVMYRPEEAMHLGYAFKNGMNFYGIGQITVGKTENLILTVEEVRNSIEDCKANSYFQCFPLSFKTRFIELFGNVTKVFKDPISNKFFSELDIKHGTFEIPKEVKSRLIPHQLGNEIILWDHFFSTETARLFCLSQMTSSEKEEFKQNLEKTIKIAKEVAEKSLATIENPIVVDLFGTDDISYAKSVPDMNKAFELLNEIEKKGHYITMQEMCSA